MRAARIGWSPIAAGGCPTATSPVVVFDVEHLFNLVLEHRVEIVRDLDLSCEEVKTLRLLSWRRVERDDLDQGLPGLGDDKGLALGGAIHQPRQMRLGLMHIDGSHAGASPTGLTLLSPPWVQL